MNDIIMNRALKAVEKKFDKQQVKLTSSEREAELNKKMLDIKDRVQQEGIS